MCYRFAYDVTQRTATASAAGASGRPLILVDTMSRSSYVLLPSHTYERVRALFDEGEFRSEEWAPLMDEVAAKEGWTDPAMDAYDAKAATEKGVFFTGPDWCA